MDDTGRYASDIAFTPTVKEIQTRKGSRGGYRHMEERAPRLCRPGQIYLRPPTTWRLGRG